MAADALALAALAERTFRAAFGESNSAADMDAYVCRAFAPNVVRDELDSAGTVFFVALLGSRLVGYAKLRREGNDGELQRIYAEPAHIGHGLGAALMQACLTEADAQGLATIRLGVWEHNRRAIGFYERWGFARTGTQVFQLGSDVQTDIVMERPVRVEAVDVFTGAHAEGNVAGVCILARFPADEVMQRVAAANRWSQTAFAVRRGAREFDLRWFTPKLEDDLCGHATLATACIVAQQGQRRWPVWFHTRSGTLEVGRERGRFVLTLPAWVATPVDDASDVLAALGLATAEVSRTRDFLVVVDSEETVRSIEPDFVALASLEPGLGGVIVSAPCNGGDVDYVVRFFAPAVGIDEDPATGSAACTHAPYWAARLGQDALHVHQASRRGGRLHCTVAGRSVRVAGAAVRRSR